MSLQALSEHYSHLLQAFINIQSIEIIEFGEVNVNIEIGEVNVKFVEFINKFPKRKDFELAKLEI